MKILIVKFGIIKAFIQHNEQIYVLIQQLNQYCNFLANLSNNDRRPNKFDKFYFIGALESDFHIIPRDKYDSHNKKNFCLFRVVIFAC